VLRAARKNRCHETLRDVLVQQLDAAANLPESLANELRRRLTRAVALVARAASAADGEELARQAASGLYYATAAAVLAIEGATIGATTGDAGRLLLSRAAVREKLSDRDPLSGAASDPDLLSALVDGTPISMETAQRLCG
jgi:acyl-CoA dehydrogenase